MHSIFFSDTVIGLICGYHVFKDVLSLGPFASLNGEKTVTLE